MKLKLPAEVILYAIENLVKIEQMAEPDDCGEYDYHDKIITINETFAEQARVEMLFHEVAESANYTLELDLTHSQLCGIATSFFEFIVNNIDRMVERDG